MAALSDFAARCLRSPQWDLVAALGPTDTAFSSLAGALPLRGSTLEARLSLDPTFDLKKASVAVPPAFCAAMPGPAIAGCLQQSRGLSEFLEELVSAAHQAPVPTRAPGVSESFFPGLLSSLAAVGWHRVSSFDDATRTVGVECVDGRGRAHTLRLTLPDGFPADKPTAAAFLPQPFEFPWAPGASLLSVVDAFEAVLPRYASFWDVMDDLDAHTWVLDPDPGPHRRSLPFRRIAVGQYSWLHLTVSWASPRAVCECHFVGAGAVVAPLRQKFASRITLWSDARTVRENIEALLEVRLPTPAAASEAVAVECGVCYSYKLSVGGEDATPDFRCEAPLCGRAYHVGCLGEWLAALPTTRKSFGMLFGQCPYCQNAISLAT